MWTPKQLLHEKIIDALYLGGFTTLQIEFLGWLSYNAKALNNSRNPVKAAHTILAKCEDPDSKMSKMLTTFTRRKTESIAPTEVEAHDDTDKAFERLEDFIDTEHTKARMRATTYEDFTKGGVSDGGVPVTPEEVDQ
jgi:hypothetical protein